jgi:hypothetical protein
VYSAYKENLDTLDVIKSSDDGKNIVIKLDFKVAIVQRETTPKRAGNRVIALLDNENKQVRILMVYKKKHVKGKETVWWKGEIARNFSLSFSLGS